MAKSKLNKSELEGLHYDILEDFIANGTSDDMDDDMMLYLEQLKFVHSRLHRVESPGNVVKSLRVFYSLDPKTALSRFNDALKFFYLDKEVSNDIYRSILFEIAMKAIQLAVKTADSPEVSLKIVDAVKKAGEIKGLHLPDKEEIPEGLLEEKVEIFTLTPGDLGLTEANRKQLAAQIDQMPLKEEQKLRIKQDASVEPREFFRPNEQT
ncbi:hypothetical protein [Lacinutrix sp. Hel_I_90]|uniref:hypothetical protein n=1 Tax=Lacinutrix sp. Hel_I_90 TaxID=1249999 RepID=UPI0005CB03A4|nr:hypothetical protein [Lacinutrix sp. Hel_I_90]